MEEIDRLNALLTGVKIRKVLQRNADTDQQCIKMWSKEIENIIKKLEEKQQTTNNKQYSYGQNI